MECRAWMQMDYLLHLLNLTWNSAGYRYLLYAADLVADGIRVGPDLLKDISDLTGIPVNRLSKSLQKTWSELNKTELGRKAIDGCAPGDLYGFLSHMILMTRFEDSFLVFLNPVDIKS